MYWKSWNPNCTSK